MQREQWGTRIGFLFAAIGSAVGLGNIWRYPYIAYENGGGAFFLPYVVALLTAGIPILVMEYTIGKKYQGSTPISYFRLGAKRLEWVGWWQVAVVFVVATFYSVIIAWAVMYAIFAIGQGWGTDTEAFLFNNYLELAEPGQLGGINFKVFIPLILVWAVTLTIVCRGVRKGIEYVNRIFIPILLVMFIIIVIRALTLEGASVGLNALFMPQWDRIFDASVWVAAYGQIFFSLSIAMAIMVTYASYLPKSSDVTNNAFIAGLSNSSFEVLAGIGVFAAIGFMATAINVPVDDAVASGVGLAFVVFPAIINELPGLNTLFGVLFFLSLVVAGLSSLISIVEAFIASLMERFNLSRQKAVLYFGGGAMLISFLYATRGGLFLLDVVDHFVNEFGIALSGLVQVIIVAWVLRKTPEIQQYANQASDIALGLWWRISLLAITPITLGLMAVLNLIENLRVPYEGYSFGFLFVAGWCVAAGTLLLGIAMSSPKWNHSDEALHSVNVR